MLMYVNYQIIRNLQLLGSVEQFVFFHCGDLCNLLIHFTHMAHYLHNVTGTGLAFGTDHRCTLVDTAQCFAQILGTADKRYVKLGFIDMVNIISRRKHLALVDIVNLQSLQNLCFYKMTDAHLCHNRNRNCVLNFLNQLQVAHACYAACCTDIGRNLFQCHNSAGTCCLRNTRLLQCRNIHNYAAL